MPDPLPLSVSLITLNEEHNLPRCLDSVRGLAAEIVIFDSGSTDRTAAIAGEYGALFEVNPWPGFGQQKNLSLGRCSQPWVLCLDADEVVSPELAGALREAFAGNGPAVEGYWLNRRTFYLGDWIWHSWYPEWRLRLIRRGSARWEGLDPHPALSLPRRTARLPGDLLHYSFEDLDDHLRRTLTYARTAAESYQREGRKAGWRQLLLSPTAALFKHLIAKRGFRDGWRGWLIAGVKWVDVFAKYAFLLEKQKVRGARQQARFGDGSNG